MLLDGQALLSANGKGMKMSDAEQSTQNCICNVLPGLLAVKLVGAAALALGDMDDSYSAIVFESRSKTSKALASTVSSPPL